MKGIFVVWPDIEKKVYPAPIRHKIEALLDAPTPSYPPEAIVENPSLLAEVDFIFSSWGFPVMKEHILEAAPKLKAIFYGAGTIKYFTTEALWKRDIAVCSAYGANAVPVAEFTFAQIIMALKGAWRSALRLRQEHAYPKVRECIGSYGSTVGLISLGMIGKLVLERLRSLDLKVIAYDPFLSSQVASELGIELCSLEEVFRESDVISLHTPWLKETENMIRGSHFDSMKHGASFINTSRGAIVHETEMIESLVKRPDLTAFLDVTWPEPPPADSPLYTLQNVMLTPHIAGSMAGECGRMGLYMMEELERYLRGEKFRWAISREMAERMA